MQRLQRERIATPRPTCIVNVQESENNNTHCEDIILCVCASLRVCLSTQGMEGGAHQLLHRPIHEATRLPFLLKYSLLWAFDNTWAFLCNLHKMHVSMVRIYSYIGLLCATVRDRILTIPSCACLPGMRLEIGWR